MVFGIRKSNSLPILYELSKDDEALNNNNERLDTNRLSTALASDSNNNNDKIDNNCKHYSLLRKNDNNQNNNKLKINTQVLYENIIKKNNSKSKIDHIESLLSPRVNTRKTTTTKIKSNQPSLVEFHNINNNKKSSDPVRNISLKKGLKEPVSRVIKITEIIEIDDENISNNKLTKNSLLNKYCFDEKSKDMLNFVDMISSLSTSPDSDVSTEKQVTTTTSTTTNAMNESQISNDFMSSNKTFIKSPSMSRKIELNNSLNRKPHQIYSTTQVKSSDHYETSKPKVHTIKIEHEKPETSGSSNKYDKLNGNILEEIMKLTSESLNNLEINKTQAQSPRTNTINTLNKTPKTEPIDDKGIPVVHNFSFVNNDKTSGDQKPKRITIKITGRTRSVSTDKRNLINKANLSLGTYCLDEVHTLNNKDNNQETVEFRLNDKLFDTVKTTTTSANMPDRYDIQETKNVPIYSGANESKFSLDKFKSYFSNNQNTANRSYSLPPNERDALKDDAVYGFTTPVKTPSRRLEPTNEVWLEHFKPESDLNMFDYSTKPFQSNQHLTLIKNAGDILNNNNSAFSCITKLDDYINNKTQPQPVWTYRENNERRFNTNEDSNNNNNNSSNKKQANLSTFGCGLLSARPKNINSQFDDRFDINELDYSPSFYSSEAHSINEFYQKNRPSRLTSDDTKLNRNFHYSASNNQPNNSNIDANTDENDEKCSTLPTRNRSMKKVASYYNDYYKDKNLFINRNKNFSQSYDMKSNNKINDNNNTSNVNMNKLSAKYIDDEDYDEDDETSDDYAETNNSLYTNKNLTYLDESIRSASFRVNKTNESLANSEATSRTPKISRRVIFADEC